MKFLPRGPFLVLAAVLVWRLLMFLLTAQPVPASDAFGYDGAVVNYLHGRGYCNPSLALVFPISGRQVYAMYPPLYQGVLLVWMKAFGTSALSAMGLHLALFALSGFLTVWLVCRYFPPTARYALAVGFMFGFTFDDRPESLAYVFGLLALGFAARQLTDTGFRWSAAASLLASLLLCLYTSIIVGAYFFGIAFLACATACVWRPNLRWFIPFGAAAGIFVAVTFLIARGEPLWWAGFMESAREQSVMTSGFHGPAATDVMKLIRTVPVFWMALGAIPWIIGSRKEKLLEPAPWLALVIGILVMGWALFACSLTLLPANYCNYAILTQILLAAGLLAWASELAPQRQAWLRRALWAGVLLVSVRAIGMTTWGVACAWKNSYSDTQALVRRELAPFAATNQPVLISSAYLYWAAECGVKEPVHSDWYFDHAHWTNHVEFDSLRQLEPSKLVLTQFDFYRNFGGVLAQLRQHPGLVEVRVRNLAWVRSPDSIPSLQRVVQHISWAPVIVDLNWEPRLAPGSGATGHGAWLARSGRGTGCGPETKCRSREF